VYSYLHIFTYISEYTQQVYTENGRTEPKREHVTDFPSKKHTLHADMVNFTSGRPLPTPHPTVHIGQNTTG
jgi:hypothetical protein